MSVSAFPYGTVAAANASGSGGVVALTGGTISHVDSGVLVHSGITFHPNGYCYDLGIGIGDRTLFITGEWWSALPETNIGASYDVRCSSITSGTWSVQAATVGTWVQINSERIWRNTVASMASPSTKTTTAVFEIRLTGSGSALDSASYTVTAQN